MNSSARFDPTAFAAITTARVFTRLRPPVRQRVVIIPPRDPIGVGDQIRRFPRQPPWPRQSSAAPNRAVDRDFSGPSSSAIAGESSQRSTPRLTCMSKTLAWSCAGSFRDPRTVENSVLRRYRVPDRRSGVSRLPLSPVRRRSGPDPARAWCRWSPHVLVAPPGSSGSFT